MKLRGAIVLLVLLLGYMLFWWNRGIQLNSNGMPTLAAEAMLSGKVPYLDFHFWCPPGHILVYKALAAMFGDGLIYVRAFAVAERMAIFLLLYFWLARVFSARAAFFGTFAAGVGFSSDVCDVIAHYDFDAVVTSIGAGFTASIALTSRRRGMFFLTGIFAGACMVAKQTQGVGMFLLFLTIFLLTRRVWGALEYLAGWIVPTGLTALWLIKAGAWQVFLKQTFLQGTSSKGSLSEILIRPLYALTYDRMLLASFLIALMLLGAYVYLLSRQRQSAAAPAQEPALPWLLWLSCLAALAIGFAWAWSAPGLFTSWRKERALIAIAATCIFTGMLANLWLAAGYTIAAIRGRLTDDATQKWLLASVSAITAYMFSLSWAAYEKMLIPGFAFLLAMALDRQLRRGWRAPAFAIAALGLVLVASATVRKLTWPYAWENWVDGPIPTETVAVNFPEMRGIRVSPESAAFIDRVTHTIEAHSRPDETILCYPNYALFYVLSHRAPGVFAYMHWFDIVSDDLARADAARVREHPPAVILYVDLSEERLREVEKKFRGGRRSGQRDMMAAIQSLPGYRVIETVPIPHMDFPLRIYARN